MNNPKLLHADRPMRDLDEGTGMDMIYFFINMKKCEGITFVLVTHKTDFAKQTRRQLRMLNGPIRTQ